MKTTKELEDAVRQYQNGDTDSFERIYDLSYRYLYTCVIHVVKDEEIAADMLQETYLEISRNIPQLKSAEDFLSWASTIGNRKCYAYLKKQRDVLIRSDDDQNGDAQDFIESIADDEAFIPETILQDREKQRLVQEIIDGLSDMQRLCIIGFYYRGQSIEEIAQELEIPVNTVKSHLSRAKAKIKDAVIVLDREKGTRLYSLAPFMLLFLSKEAEACEAGPMPEVLKKELGGLGAKNLKKLLQSGVRYKLIAGAVLATVVIGGGAALIHVLPTGFGHQHVWEDATCMTPKTCSGCGETEGEALGHTWSDAACAEPKTCSICGETEGEALGHAWADATCSAPMTCSVCGETEGDALEHTLSEANYQQAAVCEVCGVSVGEPLQADFEKYNLTEHMVELDQECDYITLCYENSAYTTVGKVTFSNYRTFDSDETHEAKEGYEWKMVDVTVAFGDENAWEYGMIENSCFENYYDIIKNDDTLTTDDNGMGHFTVNWNGVDYTECCYISDGGFGGWTDNTDPAYGDWEHIDVFEKSVAVLVPIGYDGIVVGVRNAAVEWGEGQHVFDLDNTDTLFFRMN